MHSNLQNISCEIHFHIRWVSSGAVDWERHGTRAEAEEAAKQLSLKDEKFTVEQFDETCPKCQTLAHPEKVADRQHGLESKPKLR